MNKFILRTIINAVGLYAAVAIVPGITPEDPNYVSYLWIALIFGILNALVRPILKLLTCPLILLTLGLFTLVINTLMIYLTGYVGSQFGVGLIIDDFLSAFLGALVVSIVSVLLTFLVRDEMKGRRKKKKKQS